MKRITCTRLKLPSGNIELREARIISNPPDQWAVWIRSPRDNESLMASTAVMLVDQDLLLGEDRGSIIRIIRKVRRCMEEDHGLEFSWAPVTRARMILNITSTRWPHKLKPGDLGRQLVEV